MPLKRQVTGMKTFGAGEAIALSGRHTLRGPKRPISRQRGRCLWKPIHLYALQRLSPKTIT
jgi:hypothetical protein